MVNNKFSGIIGETDMFFYLSDFVTTDSIEKEYKTKFGKYDCLYSRSKKNSGIYLLKLYYR